MGIGCTGTAIRIQAREHRLDHLGRLNAADGVRISNDSALKRVAMSVSATTRITCVLSLAREANAARWLGHGDHPTEKVRSMAE